MKCFLKDNSRFPNYILLFLRLYPMHMCLFSLPAFAAFQVCSGLLKAIWFLL